MGGWYPGMGGWTIGLGFTLHGKRTFVKKESRLEREREGEVSHRRAWSYPLCCAHFCRLPDRLKGLGSTIPFIHCSLGLLLSDTATPPCVVASHFPFAAPPPFLLRGIGMFPLVILFAPILPPGLLGSVYPRPFLPLVSQGVTLLSEITRKAYLYFTVVERVLYTCLRQDIFSSHVMKKRNSRLRRNL